MLSRLAAFPPSLDHRQYSMGSAGKKRQFAVDETCEKFDRIDGKYDFSDESPLILPLSARSSGFPAQMGIKKAPAAQAFDKTIQAIDKSTVFHDRGMNNSTIPPDFRHAAKNMFMFPAKHA